MYTAPHSSSPQSSQPPPAKRARYDPVLHDSAPAPRAPAAAAGGAATYSQNTSSSSAYSTHSPTPTMTMNTQPHSSSSQGQEHAQHAQNQQRQQLPSLSLSVVGVEPLDEFIREVADFIDSMIRRRPDGPGNVEVEAKIGVLRDKATSQRIVLPVLTETILTPEVDLRFESNMSLQQHRHYNALLNRLKTNPPIPSSPVEYQHLYLVDSFYPNPDGSSEKIRVTRDEKTNTVRECVKKIRLGDLNIYSPKRMVDWRISVNYEIPVTHPIGTSTHSRRKDRMSYKHEEFVIDLTQVTASGQHQMLHELEVEIARPDFLLAVQSKRGDPQSSEMERSAFDELIRAFVNNARMLTRNAEPER